MPTHRRNHYVPRFYLKNFATSGGRRIHLSNIPSGRNVLNASLRDQCYGSRFYGKDPNIEHGLADLEEATAAVIRDVLGTKRLPKRGSEDHCTLMAFTVTQHNRTQMSAATTDAMTDGMLKTAYRDDPRFKDFDFEKHNFQFENSVLLPLTVAAGIYPLTLDLHLRLLVNHTATQFITSDNPVVLHNTHCQDVRTRGCIGWGCAGLEVFLPLSPEVSLYAYDAAVYKVANRWSQVCRVTPRDTRDLNRLQWLNALQNVFYAADEYSTLTESENGWAKTRRPTAYTGINEAVAEDDENVRLIHTFKPGLNVKLAWSFSIIRRHQRNVPEDRRGAPRQATQNDMDRHGPTIPSGIGTRVRTFRTID